MTILDDKYYDGIVVSDEVDPNHAGAVRTKIFGVTDELEDKDQPFSIPAVLNFSAVPTKGSLLEIVFDEGDVNKPKYFNASAEASYLPEDFVNAGYPDIAIANLGGDFFSMRHDRANRETIISHPSDSTLTWNVDGNMTLDSDKAFEQTGRGAKVGEGAKNFPVLTEATIDIFCCTPVGSGENASQGSEYLHTSHISKATIKDLRGEGSIQPQITSLGNFEAFASEIETKPFNNTTVEFSESPSSIEVKPANRKVNVILVTSTTDTYMDTVKNIGDKASGMSAHYIVGAKPGSSPENKTGTGDEGNTSAGFSQAVDLLNEAKWFSNSIQSPVKPQDSANKNSVIVVLTDGGTSKYQTETMIPQITEHVRNTFPDTKTNTPNTSIEVRSIS